MEHDLDFLKMEDDLNILINVSKPDFCSNGREPIFFVQMEDNLIFLATGRQHKKAMVVAQIRVT